MKSTNARAIGAIVVLSTLVGPVNSGFAVPAPSFTHTWNMQSGPEFDDFHANYIGTGGSITDLTLTIDEPGGGMIGSNPNSSQADIAWDHLVGPSQVFGYEFNTGSGSAAFISATLTRSDPTGGSHVVGIVDTTYKIFDPTSGQQIGIFTVVFVPSPGALMLVACGVAIGRRRRSA